MTKGNECFLLVWKLDSLLTSFANIIGSSPYIFAVASILTARLREQPSLITFFLCLRIVLACRVPYFGLRVVSRQPQ